MKYHKYSQLFLGSPEQRKNQRKKEALHLEQMESLTRASEIALVVIAVLGVAAITIVAPNLLQALDKLVYLKKGLKASPQKKREKTLKTFFYLKERGLIKFKSDGNSFKVFLTSLGKRNMKRINIAALSVPKPKKWDGKWWQVAADIPTKHYRQGADLLRSKLKQMGFCSLQRTLWFYPFDPRSEIEFICREFGIANFVTVMEISRMDLQDERLLKKYFRSLKKI